MGDERWAMSDGRRAMGDGRRTTEGGPPQLNREVRAEQQRERAVRLALPAASVLTVSSIPLVSIVRS
jgi:hypothetical protein